MPVRVAAGLQDDLPVLHLHGAFAHELRRLPVREGLPVEERLPGRIAGLGGRRLSGPDQAAQQDARTRLRETPTERKRDHGIIMLPESLPSPCDTPRRMNLSASGALVARMVFASHSIFFPTL